MRFILLFLLCCGTLFAAEIGKPVLALESGPMLKGDRLDLAGLKGKKIVVLHFWKTQCPACEKAVPMLNEMAAKYRGKAAFMAIGTDMPNRLRQETHWRNFICPVMADALHKNQAEFLPKGQRFPADAVIDRDGTLLWVGTTIHLPEVLNDVVSGKFDLRKAVETDRFNRAMKSAMEAKDYSRALKILRERQQKYPDDPELCIGEASILAESMKQPEEALKVLDRAIQRNPAVYRFYQTKLKILQLQNKPGDLRQREVYRAIAKVFAAQPMMLARLSGSLMMQRAGTADLVSVYMLAHAAYTSKMLRPGPERGIAAAALARSYYYIGMLERAVLLQTEAVRNMNGIKEQKRAILDLQFYRNAVAAEQEVRKLEKKK